MDMRRHTELGMKVHVGAGWLGLISEVGGGSWKKVAVGKDLGWSGKSGGAHREGSGGEGVRRVETFLVRFTVEISVRRDDLLWLSFNTFSKLAAHLL